MIPLIFAASVLLGVMAWSAKSLAPAVLGHFLMDVFNFGYWWTGLIGEFEARPISETGLDGSFIAILAALLISSFLLTIGVSLSCRRSRRPDEPH